MQTQRPRTSFWIILILSIALFFASAYLAYSVWVKDFIAEDRCLDAGGAYEKVWQTCSKSMSDGPKTTFDGPVYAGSLDGKEVSLQLRDDFSGYRMVDGGLRVVGDLNTEKGFGKEDNAVVYVLNPSAEAAKQLRFLLKKGEGVDSLLQVVSYEHAITGPLLLARRDE
jgi:hypothetical protein